MSEESQRLQCPYCGASVTDGSHFCGNCHRQLPDSSAAAAAQKTQSGQNEQERQGLIAGQGAIPKTIRGLQVWAATRNLPLEQMRFFVGVDYRQPKAFGIFEDAPGHFTVYKNKADGSRSVRYAGPDEAYAVRELYEKLLDECHVRGKYPDRTGLGVGGSQSMAGPRSYNAGTDKSQTLGGTLLIILAILLGMVILSSMQTYRSHVHDKDGYYRRSDNTVYYRYGYDCYRDGITDWYEDNRPRSETDSFLGSQYSSSYGVSNFRNSHRWDTLHESRSRSNDDSSSVWDWDTDDTDWDSDW